MRTALAYASDVANDVSQYWGPFDAMRFALFYEGSLPASGNPRGAGPPKLAQIWDIRNALQPQITRIYETHPAFRGGTANSRALLNALDQPLVVGASKFYPIARLDFKLKCDLDIRMHVNHPVSSLVTNAGDLDNRLKTLLDALRAPAYPHEIKNYMPGGVDPYCCLLENDVSVSALKIEMFHNMAAPPNAPLDHVRLEIVCHLEPAAYDFLNEPFRGD